MKKIYSILLMAVALLISTNLKAETLLVGENQAYQTLEDAFEAADNGDIIQLQSALSTTATTEFVKPAGSQITLDLNGQTITNNGKKTAVITIYRGTLNVIGTGSIIAAGEEGKGFQVRGTLDTIADFAGLIIGENVTVNAQQTTANPYGKGIEIYTNNSRTDASKGLYRSDFNASYPSDYAGTKITANAHGLANGVHVTVYGTVLGGEYGVQVSGVVRDPRQAYIVNTSDEYKCYYYFDANGNKTKMDVSTEAKYNRVRAYAPKVTIASTAIVRSNATTKGSTAVYCAGYGSWDISGTCEGNVGVYVKSGEIELNDATITSTNNLLYARAEETNSNVTAQGSALVIQSSAAYSGEQHVTINGDSKLEAEKGYAIMETVTTANTETKVDAIEINGGTFVGGDKGAIALTETTVNNDATKITVLGGTVNGTTEISGNATSLETLAGTGNNTIITEVKNNDGTTSYVISKVTAEEKTQLSTLPLAVDLNSYTSDARPALNLSGLNKTTGLTINANTKVQLGDVIMNNTNLALTITIPEGSTLLVKTLTMNKTAQIIVKAGAKLIVDGNQGVYADTTSNIIIEAEDGNMGLFYFNPAVSSNKHPNATVQLYSNGYLENGVYHFQRFGVPVFTSLSHSQMTRKYSTNTYYYYWDNTINDWAPITSATYEMKPFVGLTMTSTYGSAGNIYSMPGELYGNVNAELNYLVGWNYFANSYTGQMDIKDLLLDILNAHNDEIEGGVQIYDAVNDTWNAISKANIQEGTAAQTKIEPMQAIVLKNISDATITNAIDYENVLWNHRDDLNETSAAPARRGASANYDLATIVISNDNAKQTVTLRQGAQFSNEFDNGYDLSKYMYGAVNVYAETANGNMAQVASDNIYGQTITVNTNSAKSFKMTFENLNGATFAIRDNVTGSVIDMTENAEYYFTADAYNGENRFEIVEARKMPTDVEVVDAAKAQKGIYSLVGAYLGEDFDVLPAGIYVVNGVKVVK